MISSDSELIEQALEKELDEETREEFEGMRERKFLTPKQRSWIMGVLEIPEYENLVSSGKVPRGRPVATPSVLQNIPKRPPGRA